MTTACGGGTSSFKPQYGKTVFMAPAGLAAMLNNIPVAWAVPLALLLAAKTYDLNNFCTTDPPADPGFTAADAIDFLNVYNPAVQAPASAKLQQLVDRFAWGQLCQCDGGVVPTLPTAPSAPTDLPTVNPPVGSVPNTGCGQWAGGPVAMDPTGATAKWLLGNGSGVGATLILVPPGVTSLSCIVTDTANGSLHGNVTVNMRPASSTGGGGISGSVLTIVTSGSVTPATFTWPSNGVGFTVDAARQTSGVNSSDLISIQVIANCGSQPGQPSSPCCPPDPVLQAQLDKILGLVTLIQRQSVPFAYVPGTAHTGLSGNGTLSVSGLIGAKISITTDPATLGVASGSPSELFDRGFITWGTPDGYPQSERLEHNPQLSLPARCGAFTDLAYTLHPGVVATITELIREP